MPWETRIEMADSLSKSIGITKNDNQIACCSNSNTTSSIDIDTRPNLIPEITSLDNDYEISPPILTQYPIEPAGMPILKYPTEPAGMPIIKYPIEPVGLPILNENDISEIFNEIVPKEHIPTKTFHHNHHCTFNFHYGKK